MYSSPVLWDLTLPERSFTALEEWKCKVEPTVTSRSPVSFFQNKMISFILLEEWKVVIGGALQLKVSVDCVSNE